MRTLCIEDSFEYNIKRAIARFFEDFDTPEEAKEAFSESDHFEQFLTYFYEQALEYTDVEQLVKDFAAPPTAVEEDKP